MLLPLFLNLAGRRVVLVGGGPVAAAKLQQLLAARASVCVIATTGSCAGFCCFEHAQRAAIPRKKNAEWCCRNFMRYRPLPIVLLAPRWDPRVVERLPTCRR